MTNQSNRGPRIPEEAVITLLSDKNGVKYGAENNPKRPGSESAERFTKYADGITVAEAKELGIRVSDVRYDVAHGYISLTPHVDIQPFKRAPRKAQNEAQLELPVASEDAE